MGCKKPSHFVEESFVDMFHLSQPQTAAFLGFTDFVPSDRSPIVNLGQISSPKELYCKTINFAAPVEKERNRGHRVN